MKRKLPLIVMCTLYILAGINHFINPAFYLKIMPHYIPYHLFLIYLSGIIEIVLGSLAIIYQTRKLAGWLLIAMLIAFLPVHIQMIIDNLANAGWLLVIALIRLPLQFLLIYWVYRICRLRPVKQNS